MHLADTWAVAQVCYAAAGMATIGIAWGIRRSHQPRRERLVLLGSLVALALHYGAATADAALQAPLDGHGAFTLWTATGQFLLLVFWVLLLLFLVYVIRSVLGPVVNTRRVTFPAWVMVVLNALAVAHGFIAGVAHPGGYLTLPEPVRAPTLYVMLVAGLSLALYPAYEALPDAHQSTWTRWLSGHALSWRTAVSSGHSVERRADVKVWFSIYGTALLLVAITVLVNETAQWTSARVALVTLCRILVLPSILGLLYFQARFVEFDTFVTRTITFASMSVGLTLIWLLGLQVTGRHPASGAPLLCAAAILMVYATGTLLQHADRWLARRLFGRPRYDVELRRTVDRLARAETRARLHAVVTQELSRVFPATSVQYTAARVEESAFTLEVGTGGARHGYLCFGPRPRGQYFRSEDQRFIQEVAAYVAARMASVEAQEARALATEAEGKALRAQINPHFLLNGLNALAEMAVGHAAIERMVLNLGHVCRYALTSSTRHQVPLHEELAAVEAYLAVERERFEARLHVAMDVSPEVRDHLMPPMVVQPLVENAVRHGIGGTVAGGTVRVTAGRWAGMLRVIVSDDGVGFDPRQSATGIGLPNVRARVAALGGQVDVRSVPGMGTDVMLTLPAVRAAGASSPAPLHHVDRAGES